ncbi:MAG: hypothetical protein ACYCQI_07130 [Gammaproteobacteria bacterium]
MKIQTFLYLSLALIILIFFTGCENTMAGLNQDIQNNAHKMQQSVNQ